MLCCCERKDEEGGVVDDLRRSCLLANVVAEGAMHHVRHQHL
jgi:hypothetical protein